MVSRPSTALARQRTSRQVIGKHVRQPGTGGLRSAGVPQCAHQQPAATDLSFEDQSLRLHLQQVVCVPQHQDRRDILEVRDIGNHGTGQIEML